MSEPNEQDMSHPLERTTGERDVHPEEESGRQRDEDTDDTESQGDSPETGETP